MCLSGTHKNFRKLWVLNMILSFWELSFPPLPYFLQPDISVINFYSKWTPGKRFPSCLSMGLPKSKRNFGVWIWLGVLDGFLQLPLRDWWSGTQPQILRGSVKSLCSVCAAELGQARGKDRKPIFPKYYLELTDSTKCTTGLTGIKQVLTNHGSALISLWSSAVHSECYKF